MRIRYLLATVVTGVAASNGFAQTGGTGNTGGGAPSGLQTGNASNFQIQQLTQAPQINSAETSGSTVNSTNGFSQYYANPLYQGRAGATNTELPGGFGSAMAATGGAGGGRAVGTAQGGRTGAGATGGRTATTTGGTGATGGIGGVGGATGGATGGGRAGGLGGTTALGGATQFGGQANRAGGAGGLGTQRGGLGGQAGQQQQANAIVQLPRQISYTMTMRMPMPKSTPVQIATQMQTDLRSVIDRSSSIANPKGIEVVTDGSVVVLRGRVKDEEEAATAEGVIRLTPGVKAVKNELKY